MWKLIIPFAFLFSCCTGVKETIINTQTGEKMIGFSSDCKYRIGKTDRSVLTDERQKDLRKDSLQFFFKDAAWNKEHKKLLGGSGHGKYSTSKGLKIGDSVEVAVEMYGKPVATELIYWQDEKHRIIWGFKGLFYKNLSILVDPSTKKVIGIEIGRQFPIDKKYRRKSSWYTEK